MSGTSRSGRRKLAPTVGALPPLKNDTRDVAKWIAMVVERVADGRIDPRVGDTLLAGARLLLTQLRSDRQEAEIARLEQLVRRREEVGRQEAEREQRQRDHMNLQPEVLAEIGEGCRQADAATGLELVRAALRRAGLA